MTEWLNLDLKKYKHKIKEEISHNANQRAGEDIINIRQNILKSKNCYKRQKEQYILKKVSTVNS